MLSHIRTENLSSGTTGWMEQPFQSPSCGLSVSQNICKWRTSRICLYQPQPGVLLPLCHQVEFGLPDLEGRAHILSIHSKSMNVDRNIRYELIARLCPNTTGAELRSVCTEAGMFAIRARKKSISEKDFLDAVNKVIKGYQKFSSTPKYMVYN